MDKVVIYAATRNFYKYLPMAIGSLLDTNPDSQILVIAEDDYIDTIVDPRIVVYDYKRFYKYLDENGPNYNTHWTYMSLTRLFLSKIIDSERVLWLDVDTLVLDKIDELFEMDMENKAVAMVMEPKNPHENTYSIYCNSGVAVFNLKLIRELRLDDKMIELINTKKFTYPDQDVINKVCKCRIKYLHPKYNISPSTTNLFKPVIFHFTYKKLWDNPYVQIWEKFYKERL